MIPAFRWFGPDDRIPLRYIRQIPGVTDIVGSLFDIPAGEIWPLERITDLRDQVEAAGLRLRVIESIPVHEDIKRGAGERDRWIENYATSIRHVATVGVEVLCYNFMPVFDWIRTSLATVLPDGSTTLSYHPKELTQLLDPSKGLDLPAWIRYDPDELKTLLDGYQEVDNDGLWTNLEYFLTRIVPVAEESGVRLAIHPDDPPWPVLGLPRIIHGREGVRRLLDLVDSPANGITFCAGSLAEDPAFDVLETLREFVQRGRVHFMHLRNIEHLEEGGFREVATGAPEGALDMVALLRCLKENGFQGPIRPDHGRLIWDEDVQGGYGLYDRALGIMYLQGVWEGIRTGSQEN